MMDQHRIQADGLSGTIAAAGAELVSLRTNDGTELIWQAGPVWPRHAPLLFPIVGRLAGDTLHHAGHDYRMTQHGFARDRQFVWAHSDGASCRLLLADDDWTRARYPFAFRLEVTYTLVAGRLAVTMRLENPGDQVLPASLGAHPAFNWPLRPGLAREEHRLTFEHPEPAPIRCLSGGLVLPDARPSPVQGRVLALHEDLFANDALILDPPASRWVRYTAPGAPVVTVDWENCPQLGLWSKPGDFVCIEPWHGIASPIDFDGEFRDKPGLLLIPPGGQAQIGFGIAVTPQFPDQPSA